MIPIRSFLFVPGNRESWIEKVPGYGADAVILDLEDSVPAANKAEARELVASKIAWLADQNERVYVRVNRSPHLYDFEDLLAVCRDGLEGIVMSKPGGPEDMHLIDAQIAEAEMRNGLDVGALAVVPTLETARSIQLAYEMACHPRTSAICGPSAKNGDVARAVGFRWTVGGRETLYMKSRVVIAARAAGKQPMGGLWQQVHDLDGHRAASDLDRDLGMTGEMILHPAAVPVVNAVYSPSPEDVAYYQGMIEAFDAGVAEGRAAVVYDGEHIDLAHVKTAREIVELARSLEQ